MKKYQIGLVIGRFQPFHYGHLYLLKESLKTAEKIVIGIGSSNKKDLANPYTYQERKKMIKQAIEHENVRDRVLTIIPLPDHPDDLVWLYQTLRKTGKIDLVIGDNDWVNGIFEEARYLVKRIGFYKRDILEGKKIRKLIENNDLLTERVPLYIQELLNNKK